MRRRIKSKVYLSLILTCVLTTVIGLTYGVFTITTGKYKVAEMLISNLMYGIDITTTGGSETIENKTVTLRVKQRSICSMCLSQHIWLQSLNSSP